MIEYLYIPIILLLYLKTWRYNKNVDDPVPREGYLYELPRKVPYQWYDKRRPLSWVITNLAIYISVCSYIHITWNWQVAVLYACSPLNVWQVAWGRTGSYYSACSLLILATHYWLVNGYELIQMIRILA